MAAPRTLVTCAPHHLDLQGSLFFAARDFATSPLDTHLLIG